MAEPMVIRPLSGESFAPFGDVVAFAGRDFFPSSQNLKRVRPFAFADVGYIENNDPSASETDDEFLSSVGVGVDLEFERGFYVQSYVAVPTTSGPDTVSGDPAFYLALSKSW